MKTKMYLLFLILIFPVFSGCANLKEAGHIIWGNSIKAMEDARGDAEKRTYYCGFDACFDAVLNMAKKDQGVNPPEEDNGIFNVFSKNPVKGYIVVMGIDGNIDTTEVGIFFVELGKETIRIEISSASTSAKENVSSLLFKRMDALFSQVK